MGRPVHYDEDAAQALIGWLEAGEPIRQALRRPGMPRWDAYRRWLDRVPAFAAAVAELKAQGRARRRAQLRARYRAYDHAVALRICDEVAEGAALRALLPTDKAFPAWLVLQRWRRQRPDFGALLKLAIRRARARRRQMGALTASMRAKVLRRIRMGATLSSLGREPGFPCVTTLYAWVRKDPDFAEAVNIASDRRDERLADLACDAVVYWSRGEPGAEASYVAAKTRYEEVTRKRAKWRR